MCKGCPQLQGNYSQGVVAGCGLSGFLVSFSSPPFFATILAREMLCPHKRSLSSPCTQPSIAVLSEVPKRALFVTTGLSVCQWKDFMSPGMISQTSKEKTGSFEGERGGWSPFGRKRIFSLWETPKMKSSNPEILQEAYVLVP